MSILSLYSLHWHLVSDPLPFTLRTLLPLKLIDWRGCPEWLTWLGWSGTDQNLANAQGEALCQLSIQLTQRLWNSHLLFLSWIKMHLIFSGSHFLESSTGWGFGTDCIFSLNSSANNEKSYYQLGYKHLGWSPNFSPIGKTYYKIWENILLNI